MKKILLALAVLAAGTAAYAQSAVKSTSEVRSAVETALADTQNEKKATKPATWMKLGQAYLDAYNSAQGSGIIGSSVAEVNIMMSKSKYTESKKTLGNENYTVRKYPTANYYFTSAGRLEFIETTRPIIAGSLDKALKAYSEAQTRDVKGQKKKDLLAALSTIVDKYSMEAVLNYSLGKYAESSACFEKQAQASEAAPLCVVDSNAVYNAGFTALLAKDLDRAENLFVKCLDIKYYGKGGEVFYKLSEIATQKGDLKKSKEYLEQGFSMFPDSESILVGLINYYVTSGDNPQKVFELLDKVKEKSPNNPSLYSVEGDIHEKLGEYDEAVASWKKSVEIDPNYASGYFAEGYHYMKRADDIAKEATELPAKEWKKYDELVAQYEQCLVKALPLLVKAYGLEKDEARKNAYAGLIKNASFRLREKDASYQAIYDEYKAIYKD